MRVADLSYGRQQTLELVNKSSKPFSGDFQVMAELALRYNDNTGWLLQCGEDVMDVKGKTAQDNDNLRNLPHSSNQRLCWLAQRFPKNKDAKTLTVQLHQFDGGHQWSDPVDIGIDERIVDDMRRHRRTLNSVESLVSWLDENLLLHPVSTGEPKRVLISGSPDLNDGKKVGFRIYGKGWAVDVVADKEKHLSVRRIVRTGKQIGSGNYQPLYLITGELRFCDHTVAGRFRGTARDEIAARVEQADSYLRLWQAYNDIEHRQIVDRAFQFRWFEYDKRKPKADGSWQFWLNKPKQKDEDDSRKRFGQLIERGDELQAAKDIPPTLLGQDEENDQKKKRQLLSGVSSMPDRDWRVSVKPSKEQEDRTPPEKGFLYLNIDGDSTRLERRRKAWEAIKSCANPISQLGFLLEGEERKKPTWRRREPMTPETRKVLPSPTDRQRAALDIALNTPDIALVQGPPGTGKTRVIAALQARLADSDEAPDGMGLSGNTLLTSFQHDAVENAAAATRVLGLPAIKVGYRKGQDLDNSWLESWGNEVAEKVRAARAERGEVPSIHRALEKVRRLTIRHIQTPGPDDDALALLKEVNGLAREWLSAELRNQIDEGLTTVQATGGSLSLEEEDRAAALKAARGLRCDAIAFSDDGPQAANRLLRRLRPLEEGVLDKANQTLLEQARDSDPDEETPKEMLARLASLRDQLIDQLQTPLATSSKPSLHADVQDLCAAIVDELSEQAKTTKSGVDMAVDGWLEALEKDPKGIREMIGHYSMVLAATCQQAVSKKMFEAKSGESIVFRTVVVDEAARANPLDLLIPMAQAERRIILVGDHRQLPHLLEPEVERELKDAEDTEVAMREALERSLFEKLFADLKKLEEKDGIKRTVTLDTQYRMHPRLGDFVSEQFYAPYGELLASGREAEEFKHDVHIGHHALSGKVAAWIDVPMNMGREQSGRSKSRAVEAKRVAQEAANILKQNPELSVGVITFYATQRDAIFKEMGNLGLTEQADDDGFRIADEWQRTLTGKERLRVGTVDAFQGKEFDVVLLSLTRANTVAVKDEATRRKRYGFLLLENRLCVAMSRQQRLLIIVGDRAMAEDEEAKQSVPSLHAFLQLCKEADHGSIL